MQHSESEWLTFADSDDWLHPDAIRCMMKVAQESQMSIIAGDHIRVFPDDHVSDLPIKLKWTYWEPEDYWVSNRTNATTAWGKLYRRELFQKMRYPEGKYHEDEYVTYRILFDQEKLPVIPIPLYYYYQNSTGISAQDYEKRFPDIIEALTLQKTYFHKHGYKRAEQSANEKYAEALSNRIWNAEKAGSVSVSSEAIKESRKELQKLIRNNHVGRFSPRRNEILIAAFPILRYCRGLRNLTRKSLKHKDQRIEKNRKNNEQFRNETREVL